MMNLLYVAKFDPMNVDSVSKLPMFLAFCKENGIEVDIAPTATATATESKATKATKAESKTESKATKTETKKEYKKPEDHKLLVKLSAKNSLVVEDAEGGTYAFLPSDIRQAFGVEVKKWFPAIEYDSKSHTWTRSKNFTKAELGLFDQSTIATEQGQILNVTADMRQAIRDTWNKKHAQQAQEQ